MWTFLVLCCVIISHTVQGADRRWYTTWYPDTTSEQSCRYNCGYNMGSCSCSSSCEWNGNCCHDYYSYCYTTPYYQTTTPGVQTTTPEEPATSWGSCYNNCGNDLGSCSCTSSCERKGNCCHGYYSYCSYRTTHSPGETTTYQPSCRNNCGYNMGSCSCSSSCWRNGNCCHDYYSYCYGTTSYPLTYPPATTYQPSCLTYCGSHMGSCSCSSSCEWNGNCCHDYYSYCYGRTRDPPTTASPGETTTYQPSCQSYCGSHMGSCSCSSSCEWNGNCCHDYYSYCLGTTRYPTTPSPGETTTYQPSCRYNCGYNMGSCSCSSSCQRYGNCCHDYYYYCPLSTPSPTTGYPSCRYNCGRHMGSCSCSSSCQRNGNCCPDYYSYCYYTTDFPSTEMPCGGSLFDSGTFSSPNHPGNYNNNAYCVWHLTAVNDHRVFLSFSYLELENCCSCDYISVYDGSYVSSSIHMGKVCNDSHMTFQSSSKYMTVVFRTDGSVVGRGFRADFLSSLSPSSGQVSCSSDMNIVIERSYLSSLGYDGYSLYLNDPTCRPRVTYNQVIFNYPIDTCGNVRKVVNGKVVYNNAVRAYTTNDGEITRQSHFTLNVGCHMEEDSVSQILYLVHNLNNSSMTGTGRFNTSMDFYTSSGFYYKVTQKPYIVTLNQNLYVQVDLKGHESNLVVYLDTCVTSPSPHDFQSRAYYLVRNGCPSDSTYRVYVTGTRDYARFTFKAFQFLRASESVYIQCKVRVCQASDTSRCRPTGCNRRLARDLGSEDNSHTLVLGPIELKGPEKKEEETQEQDKA